MIPIPANIPADIVEKIYKNQYWDAMSCDNFPFAVAFQLFDAAVNHGLLNARKILQRALGVKDDGVIGQEVYIRTPHRHHNKFIYNSDMKNFLAIFILCLCFTIPSKADESREFQISGMSLKESLLKYYSINEINKTKYYFSPLSK